VEPRWNTASPTRNGSPGRAPAKPLDIQLPIIVSHPWRMSATHYQELVIARSPPLATACPERSDRKAISNLADVGDCRPVAALRTGCRSQTRLAPHKDGFLVAPAYGGVSARVQSPIPQKGAAPLRLQSIRSLEMTGSVAAAMRHHRPIAQAVSLWYDRDIARSLCASRFCWTMAPGEGRYPNHVARPGVA
jgi:hypothetical protein